MNSAAKIHAYFGNFCLMFLLISCSIPSFLHVSIKLGNALLLVLKHSLFPALLRGMPSRIAPDETTPRLDYIVQGNLNTG